MELAQGFLTGNIFDWGASEAVRFFTHEQETVNGMASFEEARSKLQVSRVPATRVSKLFAISFQS